jgi:hypothetical protein
MRIPCRSLNRSGNNIGLWVAISTSILLTNSNRPGGHGHPIAGALAAFALLCAAAWLTRYYSRKCTAGSPGKDIQA